MLLAYTILLSFVLTAANPFHKYPFIFLLDVGNEELPNTNTEQIRVSIPGGSLALRYPGVGNGDTISHVRVTGIDFGTDLKANIIDGGPGYKYVVIMFTGNIGVPYDAVLTVQTVTNEDIQSDQDNKNDDGDRQDPVSEEDLNNSAEEIDRAEDQSSVQNSNYQVNEVHSNNYNNVDNEVNSDDNNNSLDEDFYHDDVNTDQHQENSNKNIQVADNDDENSDPNGEKGNNEEFENGKEKYNFNNVYEANEYYNKEEGVSVGVGDNLYYDRFNIMRPYLYNGVRVRPDQVVQYIPEGNIQSEQAQDVDAESYNNVQNTDVDDNSAVDS